MQRRRFDWRWLLTGCLPLHRWRCSWPSLLRSWQRFAASARRSATWPGRYVCHTIESRCRIFPRPQRVRRGQILRWAGRCLRFLLRRGRLLGQSRCLVRCGVFLVALLVIVVLIDPCLMIRGGRLRVLLRVRSSASFMLRRDAGVGANLHFWIGCKMFNSCVHTKCSGKFLNRWVHVNSLDRDRTVGKNRFAFRRLAAHAPR